MYVRTPWEAVANNGPNAKVLLQNRGGGRRSDIFEQLAARQTIFGNKTIIAGAYKLYYDEAAQLPKKGAGGKGAGSPRRLVSFIQQIDLTYDLFACSAEQFLALLPKEFLKFQTLYVGGNNFFGRLRFGGRGKGSNVAGFVRGGVAAHGDGSSVFEWPCCVC
jgi:hypothetical protein